MGGVDEIQLICEWQCLCCLARENGQDDNNRDGGSTNAVPENNRTTEDDQTGDDEQASDRDSATGGNSTAGNSAQANHHHHQNNNLPESRAPSVDPNDNSSESPSVNDNDEWGVCRSTRKPPAQADLSKSNKCQQPQRKCAPEPLCFQTLTILQVGCDVFEVLLNIIIDTVFLNKCRSSY